MDTMNAGTTWGARKMEFPQDRDFEVLEEMRKGTFTMTEVEEFIQTTTKPQEEAEVRALFSETLRCSADVFSEKLSTNFGGTLPWSKVRIPSTQQNLLHFALQENDIEKAEIIIKKADEEFLTQSCFDPATRQYGGENILHILTKKHLTYLVYVLPLSEPAFRRLMREETPMDTDRGSIRRMPCLHLAAFLGRENLLEIFLTEKREDVNLQSCLGDTALVLAAEEGHDNIVRLLLDKGADPNVVNREGVSALHAAVRRGHTEVVRLLTEHRRVKVNVNCQREAGLVTPVVLASALGHREILEILLDKGGNPNFLTRDGDRPLHFAAREGHTEVVRLLLGRGADLEATNKRSDTALMYATKHEQSDVMQLLLNKGARLRPSKTDEKTSGKVLHLPRNKNDHDVWHCAVRAKEDSVLKTLVRAAQERKEEVPLDCLMFVAGSGRCDRVALLLQAMDHSKTPDASKISDIKGNTILHHAALRNNYEVIRRFAETVGVDTKNRFGETALHLACKQGHHDAVQALIDAGAEVTAQNTALQTPLHLLVASPAARPQTVAALVHCVLSRHPRHGLRVTDKHQRTALHVAALHGSPDVIRAFGEASVLVELYSLEDDDNKDRNGKVEEDNNGGLPLHQADRKGTWHSDKDGNLPLHLEVRKRKLDVDEDGNLPLHLAVRKGKPEVLEAMLDIVEKSPRCKELINSQNEAKECVLHLAATSGFHELIPRLVRMEARLTRRGNRGDTVLHTLVRCMVDDPDRQENYMKVFEAVLNEFIKQLNGESDASPYRHACLTRKAFVRLCREELNEDGLSCMQLALKLRAKWFLKRFLSMDRVLRFERQDSVRYDVTDLVRKAEVLRGPDTALVLVDAPLTPGDDILDIPPVKVLEIYYGRLAMVLCLIQTALHFVYMGVFSYVGIALLQAIYHPEKGHDAATIRWVLYIFIPIEPLVIIITVLISLKKYYIKRCRKTETKVGPEKKSRLPQVLQSLKTGLGKTIPAQTSKKTSLEKFSHKTRRWLKNFQAVWRILFATSYAALVIVWGYQYIVEYKYQEYTLAAALCCGWLLTIALTRGFRHLHFWQMLQVMIIKDFTRFFFVYFFVIMGFSFGMYILFQPSRTLTDDYTWPMDTIFLLSNLLLGHGDLFDDDFKAAMNAVGRSQTPTKVLYFIYMIIAFLVLLNVLIAMMNSSYESITRKRKLQWRYENLKLGLKVARIPFVSKIITCPVREGHISLYLYTGKSHFVDIARPRNPRKKEDIARNTVHTEDKKSGEAK